MNIDRASFLALASAMAVTTGCIQRVDDGDGNNGGSGNAGANGGSGGVSIETGGSGGEGGSIGGQGGDGGAGGACDDSVGAPAACDGLDAECQPYCQGAHASLKPALAEAAVACLAASTDCFADGYNCVFDALATACPDATADADCEAAALACGEPADGEPACGDILPGMTAEGRTGVSDCVEAGCDFGVYSCAEGVVFVP